MSSVSTERRLWNCPGCGRSFRIPGDAATPKLCPECSEREAARRAGSEHHDEVRAAAAHPDEPAPGPPTSGIGPEAFLVAHHLERIGTRLDEISRSLRVFRWVVWIFAAAMVLGVALYGYTIYTARQQFSEFFQGTSGSMQDVRKQLEGIVDPRRALDSLIDPDSDPSLPIEERLK